MLKIALLYTERSRSERDLGKMIDHLSGLLAELENTQADSIILTPGSLPSLAGYHHLVFCGLDHLTLAALHLALESTDSESTRITLYDEPGASAERELNALLFRGVDHGRMPAQSVTRLTHSWSHRDIVATCKQDVLRCSDGPGPSGQPASSGSAKPTRRAGSRGSRAREVADTGTAQARKGDARAERDSEGEKPGIG